MFIPNRVLEKCQFYQFGQTKMSDSTYLTALMFKEDFVFQKFISTTYDDHITMSY